MISTSANHRPTLIPCELQLPKYCTLQVTVSKGLQGVKLPFIEFFYFLLCELLTAHPCPLPAVLTSRVADLSATPSAGRALKFLLFSLLKGSPLPKTCKLEHRTPFGPLRTYLWCCQARLILFGQHSHSASFWSFLEAQHGKERQEQGFQIPGPAGGMLRDQQPWR